LTPPLDDLKQMLNIATNNSIDNIVEYWFKHFKYWSI